MSTTHTATEGQLATDTQQEELDADLTSIELKFTWANTLRTLLALLEDGDSEGKRFARNEFSRMAVAADLGADSLTRLNSLLSDGTLEDAESLQLIDRARMATHADAARRDSIEPADALKPRQIGLLAQQSGGVFEVCVCYSARGFYIGTRDEDGLPYSRESVEYWPQRETAEACLANGRWTQKPTP